MNPPRQVVSNAGPLMVLAKLNLLHLLKTLHGRVRFAQSVYDETVTDGIRLGHDDAETLYLFLRQMDWGPEAKDPETLPESLLEARLDRGERDTLALALSLGNALVLMDETAGRRIARQHGLAVRGSLGILVGAFRRKLIDADQLRLYLTEIARREGIWINRELVARISRQVLDE